MTEMDLFLSIGRIDERFLAQSEAEEYLKGKKERNITRKYGRYCRAAAICCLLLAAPAVWRTVTERELTQEEVSKEVGSGEQIGKETKKEEYVSVFELLKTEGTAEQALILDRIPVRNRVAVYAKESAADEEKLAGSKGKELEDAKGWHTISGHEDLQYLIFESQDACTLWKFQNFESSAYAYQEVLRDIYGIYGPDDIKKITVRPGEMDHTDEGKKLQQEIGIREITGRQEIASLYQVLCSMQCYGEGRWDLIDYGASDEGMTEAVRRGRYLTLETVSGESIDTLKYTGISGMFYEYGGIAYNRLSTKDAARVEEILGIGAGTE